MSKLHIFAFLPFLLSACSTADPAAACSDYADAYNACAATAYSQPNGTYDLNRNFCDDFNELTGPDATSAVEVLNCGTDAFNAADCQNSEGFNAAVEKVNDCSSVEED